MSALLRKVENGNVRFAAEARFLQGILQNKTTSREFIKLFLKRQAANLSWKSVNFAQAQ